MGSNIRVNFFFLFKYSRQYYCHCKFYFYFFLLLKTNGPEERVYRPRSSSAHRPPRPEELTLDKNRFGSEPDLRFHAREHREHREQFSENAVRQRISRSRKKYKAPPAPPNGVNRNVQFFFVIRNKL